MNKNSELKSQQLGMPIGTATAILRKSIMFSLIKQLELDNCYQCGNKIESVDDLSIEHIVPWLHSEKPKELFFSLDNIAFSHLKCNVGSARSFRKGNVSPHGTRNRYNYHKCRCELCRRANAEFSYENKKEKRGLLV